MALNKDQDIELIEQRFDPAENRRPLLVLA